MLDFQAKMLDKMLDNQLLENKSPSVLLQLLDFCKGAAIILIVYVHFKGGWGWQGVHPFIVLSGFGLMYSCSQRAQKINWKNWYIKRTRKILPAYWLTCVLGYFVMVGVYLSQGDSWLRALSLPKRQLFFEILLLKNFHYNTIINLPNFSLWFVPFILSFYLFFPFLYQLLTRKKNGKWILTVLLGLVAFEFIYRAITIQFLDGSPIGYRNFEALFSKLDVPLNRLPDVPLIAFQGEAVFGFFPARIGEFALGMVAAIAFGANPFIQQSFLSLWAGLAGLFIWLSGDALLYSGFWGWVFADFWIALGSILCLVNVAAWVQRKIPILFRSISQIGVWSYYIFLSHFLFIYLLLHFLPEQLGSTLSQGTDSGWILVLINLSCWTFIALGTTMSCYLLKWFDRSKLADWIVNFTIAKVLTKTRNY